MYRLQPQFNKCISAIVFFTLFSHSYQCWPQDFDFGNISAAELETRADADFPNANAVVLYREVHSTLGEYIDVHERIKIFNEEGYENATIVIPYDDVLRLKGATYNLVNGSIVKTELDKDMVFTDEVVKGVEIKKFTFPNISSGSIIELSYRSKNGTFANIDLQYDIPIKRIEVKITNDSDLDTEIIQNPRAFLRVNRQQKGKTLTVSASNIPALEAENYVYDMDMYRSYLSINPTSITGSYRFNDWQTLVGAIMDVSSFNLAFRRKNYYKDELETLIGSEKDVEQQVRLVYNYLKETMSWNGDHGILPKQYTKETFKNKEGSMAEINGLFISMLDKLNIEVNPVLVSTKLNGIPLTASLGAFNTIIAGVVIDGKIRLFDIASEQSNFELLDPLLLNWRGIYINMDEKTFNWVNLTDTDTSVLNVIASMAIDGDLKVSGEVVERNGGYFDINRRNAIKDLPQDEFVNILAYDNPGLELFDVQAAIKDKGTDLEYSFEMENAIDKISDKVYFSPLFFLALRENPFQKEKRNYPIDFRFKFKQQQMIQITLPEGYKVESLPEPTKIVLPDDLGSFVYLISEANGAVRITTTLEIKEPVFSYDKYDIIKEFFKVRMAKEQEQVVLMKY